MTQEPDRDKIRHIGRPGSVPQALARDKSLSVYAKATWAVLATWATAYPGLELLSELIPCSTPTLLKALRELEEKGWLQRLRRNRRQGQTNIYILFHDGPRAPGELIEAESTELGDCNDGPSVKKNEITINEAKLISLRRDNNKLSENGKLIANSKTSTDNGNDIRIRAFQSANPNLGRGLNDALPSPHLAPTAPCTVQLPIQEQSIQMRPIGFYNPPPTLETAKGDRTKPKPAQPRNSAPNATRPPHLQETHTIAEALKGARPPSSDERLLGMAANRLLKRARALTGEHPGQAPEALEFLGGFIRDGGVRWPPGQASADAVLRYWQTWLTGNSDKYQCSALTLAYRDWIKARLLRAQSKPRPRLLADEDYQRLRKSGNIVT